MCFLLCVSGSLKAISMACVLCCAMPCYLVVRARVRLLDFFMLLFIIHILDISQLPLYNRPNTNRYSLEFLKDVEKMTILFWFFLCLIQIR